MKKLKNEKNKTALKFIKVKTGSVTEFFSDAMAVMRAADAGESVKKRHATLTFADPAEMLHFLSAAKIKLIHSIQKNPGSITNIAKAIHRNRASVYRDIHEMEQFGLVTVHEEPNPGHGRHKIVALAAPSLKLEAYI